MKNLLVFLFFVFLCVSVHSQTVTNTNLPTYKDFSMGDNMGNEELTSIFGNFLTVLSLEVCSGSGEVRDFSFSAFKKNGERYFIIEPEDLFNKKLGELLKKINAKLKARLAEISQDEILAKCFPKSFPSVTLDNLGIVFCEKTVFFWVRFNQKEDCQCNDGSLRHSVIEMPFSEVQPFLTK